MARRLPLILSATALIVAVLGFTPVGEAGKQLFIPKNTVGSKQIRDNSIKQRDLSKGVRQLLEPVSPVEGGPGVSVNHAPYDGVFVVRGGRIDVSSRSRGDGSKLMAQLEYLGGLSCAPERVTLGVTFFDRGGVILATEEWTSPQPVAQGVRYPIQVFGNFGTPKAPRVEVVFQSVDCAAG